MQLVGHNPYLQVTCRELCIRSWRCIVFSCVIRFNVKMPCLQHRNIQYKDKTLYRPSDDKATTTNVGRYIEHTPKKYGDENV